MILDVVGAALDSQILSVPLSFISALNNVAQFLLLIFTLACIAWAFLSNRYTLLSTMFDDFEISVVTKLRVMWLCRRLGRNGLRYFVELSILRMGCGHSKKVFWDEIFLEYRSILKFMVKDFYVDIKSVLDLEHENVVELSDRYFSLLKSKKEFLVKVKILDGFVSRPITLPINVDTGGDEAGRVLRKARLQIAKNDKLSHMEDDAFRRLRIYLTFEWLIWQPSYVPRDQLSSPMCLASYGLSDECEALLLAIPSQVVQEDFMAAMERGLLGMPSSLIATVVDSGEFYSRSKNILSREAVALLRGLNDGGGRRRMLIYEGSGDAKSAGSVYTAYLWIFFVRDSGAGPLSLENCVCFWEHANLADRNAYDFLRSSLIKKSFDFFDSEFSVTSGPVKYRFGFSLCQDITNSFVEELEEKRASSPYAERYRNSLDMQQKYSFDELLHAISCVCQCNAADVEILEVDYSDSESIHLLCKFYAEIMLPVFPNSNERESFDNILACLENKAEGAYLDDNYHVLIACNGGNVVGGMIFDFSHSANCGFLEYIAVRSSMRQQGIGGRIMEKAIMLLNEDARRCGTRLDWVLAESELVKVSSWSLDFFRKNGFSKIDFPYIQPALDMSKKQVDTLDLITITYREDWHSSLPPEKLALAISEYVRIAMGRADTESDPAIKTMLDFLSKKPNDDIQLKRI